VEAWEAAGRPPAGQRPGEGEVVARRADGRSLVRYADLMPLPGMSGGVAALALCAGQGVGLVERVQPAGEIVAELVDGAIRALRDAGQTIQE
jgi:hypothetical protein